MSDWTISYGGAEKSLSEWGVRADFSGEFVSKGRDTVTLATVEAFDPGAAQFAWGSPVVVSRDRTISNGQYTGGAIWFQGYVGALRMEASGSGQAIGYEMPGPWWLLERLQFKQARNVFAGWATPGQPASGATFSTVFVAESFLGEDLTEALWTGTQAIGEILAYANECWNATKRGAANGRDNSRDILQVGTIDCGQVFPKTRAQTVSCAEAIAQILRYFPTVVTWFDYTTSPPTLYLRDQANLATVSATLTASQEREVSLAPQYDRQLAGVMLCFKQTSTFNGVPWPQLYFDRYPATITDYTPNVLTHVVELAGAKTTGMSGTVAVAALAPAYSSEAGDRAAFWTGLDTSLQDPLIDPSSIAAGVPLSVSDRTGAAVDVTAYPNILLPGSEVSSWMGVQWVEATVQVQVSFNKYTDAAFKLLADMVDHRLISYRVILTNAVSKTYTGQFLQDTGDPVPPLYPAPGSLAYALYQSVSRLQYAGVFTPVGATLRSDIQVGTVLTLVGPNNTYAGLLVQSVLSRPHYGEMRVEYGPAARIDAADLVEMWRATRWRTLYNLPSGRSSGMATVTASLDTSGAEAKENTSHGLGTYSLRSATYDQGAGSNGPNGVTQIALNAQAETISLTRQNPDGSGAMSVDGNGNRVGQVVISLAACAGKQLGITTMAVCDAATGATKTVLVLASEPY
jgi:hypothetical protein